MVQTRREVLVQSAIATLGLSDCARELRRTGHDVTVLEARARPGGRAHTLREPFTDGPALGQRIRPRDLTRTSLLEFLGDRRRMPLGAIHQSSEARRPDVETAGLLGIDGGTQPRAPHIRDGQ